MSFDLDFVFKSLTLEEKASLITGKNAWQTISIDRFDIPSIDLFDGPHGIRKPNGDIDEIGIHNSIVSICYPTASAIASSWDRDLSFKIGLNLGLECQFNNISILLGPGANLKRSPLCGRNFEYFSEDSILSSDIASSFINGLQSQGIGACLKHFVCNNQETNRMTINANVSKRPLHEIYLRNFKRIIKKSNPWSIMCAYNRLNNDYCSESHDLLYNVLREDFKYSGVVISDWGAVNNPVKSIESGLDLQMPGNQGFTPSLILDAIKENLLDENILNTSVKRILSMIKKSLDNKKNVNISLFNNHLLSQELAQECIVLLKNQDKILPLKHHDQNILVVGSLAKIPRYQGDGSSLVNPYKVDVFLDEFENFANTSNNISYSDGYPLDNDEVDSKLLSDALLLADKNDLIVFFAGLPSRYESEGFDRSHINIPPNQVEVLKNLFNVNPNIILILSNGGIVSLRDFVDIPMAILETWLLGEGGAKAICNTLYGFHNPCGCLSETIPLELEHNPSYLDFPGYDNESNYNEGLFIGYRYYDSKKLPVEFEFGFGLSYSEFDYQDLKVNLTDDNLNICLNIKNISDLKGSHIVQAYIRKEDSIIPRPYSELKGFEKVFLMPFETKEVKIEIPFEDLKYYDINSNSFVLESGIYQVLIGKSSRNIILSDQIYINSSDKLVLKFNQFSLLKDIFNTNLGYNVFYPLMSLFIFGEDNIDFSDLSNQVTSNLYNFFMDMPLIKLVSFSKGRFSKDDLSNLILELNKQN